jgi:HEPN domain
MAEVVDRAGRLLAARFSRKARSDEIALDKLAGDPDVPDDLIGFHAQQALEKLFKAALAHAGVAPPRIHDLGELLALLGDARLSPPAGPPRIRGRFNQYTYH